jgi:hypothetical protein
LSRYSVRNASRRNLHIVDEARPSPGCSRRAATSANPGTKRVTYVEENTAAHSVELSTGQIEDRTAQQHHDGG